MKKLLISHPVRAQIKKAIEIGIPICLDATGEAMGDKIAILGMAQWMVEEFNLPEITIFEAKPGRTPFYLSDYTIDLRIKIIESDPGAEQLYLDCLKAGANNSLWILNPYLAVKGVHPSISNPSVRNNKIIIVPLSDVEYNQKRNMSLECIDFAYSYLKGHQFDVEVLYEKKSNILPYAKQLPFDKVIEEIGQCACFIGGDTGFSHLAVALGTPTVALFPDWFVAGKSDMQDTNTIGDWWEISARYTPYSFIPNAPYELLRIVQLADDHTFSLAHLEEAIKQVTVAKTF